MVETYFHDRCYLKFTFMAIKWYLTNRLKIDELQFSKVSPMNFFRVDLCNSKKKIILVSGIKGQRILRGKWKIKIKRRVFAFINFDLQTKDLDNETSVKIRLRLSSRHQGFHITGWMDAKYYFALWEKKNRFAIADFSKKFKIPYTLQRINLYTNNKPFINDWRWV